MSIKAMFQGMSSWVQLLFLCGLALIGLFFSSFISGIIALIYASGGNGDLMTSMVSAMKDPDFIRISQFINQIFFFLIPALICGYLFNNDTVEYFKINKFPDIKIVSLSVLLIFIIQPVINFTAYYNQKLQLPSFMSEIEKWMLEMEETNRQLMDLMLADNSITLLIVNLFIIAVMAGIVEEFFFRGSLQQIFTKLIHNYHWAVWISAFIFSAIHFQFYGFIPRLLLGAFLGYLFVWSGSLWIPILIHFLHNAMSVLVYKLYYGTPEYQRMENMGVDDQWWITILSGTLTVILMVYLSKEYTRRKFNSNDY